MRYSEDPSRFPMQGGCTCGLIRYELALPPLIVHCCHCTACQRQLGSAFAINAVVETEAIRLLPPAAPAVAAHAAGATARGGFSPAFEKLTTGSSTSPSTSSGAAPSEASSPSLVTIPSDSGIGQTIAHCPRCTTTLWDHYADSGPHGAYLHVATLDRPGAVDPDVHIYTRSRRTFVDIADGKPQFEACYPDRGAFYRPETMGRVRALAEKAGEFSAELKEGMRA